MTLEIPSDEQISYSAYLKKESPLTFCLKNIQCASSFEKYLETHIDECNEHARRLLKFKKEELKKELTAKILNTLDFPFKTKTASERRLEIMSWLEDNPAYKTNDLGLLAQRIRHSFLFTFPSRPPSPGLDTYIKEGIENFEDTE